MNTRNCSICHKRARYMATRFGKDEPLCVEHAAWLVSSSRQPVKFRDLENEPVEELTPAERKCLYYLQNRDRILARQRAYDERKKRSALAAKSAGLKLNGEAVRILRAAVPLGQWKVKDAAAVFGVNAEVIRAAVEGRTWKHIPMPEVRG